MLFPAPSVQDNSQHTESLPCIAALYRGTFVSGSHDIPWLKMHFPTFPQCFSFLYSFCFFREKKVFEDDVIVFNLSCLLFTGLDNPFLHQIPLKIILRYLKAMIAL